MTNIIEITFTASACRNLEMIAVHSQPLFDAELMERRVRVNDPRLKGPCGIDNCPSTNYLRVYGRFVCERGHEQVPPPPENFG